MTTAANTQPFTHINCRPGHAAARQDNLTSCKSGSARWRAQSVCLRGGRSCGLWTPRPCSSTLRCWQSSALPSSCGCAVGRSRSRTGRRWECGTWPSPCTEAALYPGKSETCRRVWGKEGMETEGARAATNVVRRNEDRHESDTRTKVFVQHDWFGIANGKWTGDYSCYEENHYL